MASRSDLLQGTLDLLILRTLGLGPQHGLGIARRIEQITQGTFQVKPGSLFPALTQTGSLRSRLAYWSKVCPLRPESSSYVEPCLFEPLSRYPSSGRGRHGSRLPRAPAGR